MNPSRACVTLCVLLGACVAATDEDVGQVAVRDSALRELTPSEALADFEQIVSTLRGLYGALPRKQARYGVVFEDVVTEFRGRIQRASSEHEYQALFRRFLARFRDAHLYVQQSIAYDVAGEHAYDLPLRVTPIEDRYLVAQLSAAVAEMGVTRGDELVSFDGTPAEQAVAAFMDYDGFPHAATTRQIAADLLTRRNSWLVGSAVAGGHAQLRLRKPSGDEYEVELPWLELPTHPLTDPVQPPAASRDAPSTLAESPAAAEMFEGEYAWYGNRKPFFLTPQVEKAYAWSDQVAPSAAALTAFNVQARTAAQLNYYARRYAFGGKTFLLLRIPNYRLPDGVQVTDAVNYLAALLVEQSPRVDGLIIDQTHNPGGNILLAELFATLLASEELRALVEEVHTDRRSLETYVAVVEQLRSLPASDDQAELLDAALDAAQQIDAASDANQPLTAPLPFPFFPVTKLAPNPQHWTKPFIVLADELSMSCADFLPLLVQTNQLGLVFGQTTAGAGAHVDKVTLTNTQLELSVPRGFITVFNSSGEYSDEDLVEDEGVTPDHEYAHSVEEFRAGYVPYVEAFSNALLELTDLPALH